VESPCTNAALAFTKDSTRCAGCYATLELPDGSSATCMEICAPLLVGGPPRHFRALGSRDQHDLKSTGLTQNLCQL
jgi:hypothetical protein